MTSNQDRTLSLGRLTIVWAGNPPAKPHRRRALTIGSTVVLTEDDYYLRHYSGVIPGETLGVIVGLSELNPDDTGVLVDWGGGDIVRSHPEGLQIVRPQK